MPEATSGDFFPLVEGFFLALAEGVVYQALTGCWPALVEGFFLALAEGFAGLAAASARAAGGFGFGFGAGPLTGRSLP